MTEHQVLVPQKVTVDHDQVSGIWGDEIRARRVGLLGTP